jgi:hypothetical protein
MLGDCTLLVIIAWLMGAAAFFSLTLLMWAIQNYVNSREPPEVSWWQIMSSCAPGPPGYSDASRESMPLPAQDPRRDQGGKASLEGRGPEVLDVDRREPEL